MAESWRSAQAPRRQARGIRGLAFALALLGVLLAVEQTEPGGLQLHHIHGLAVDPGDVASIYIATHAGLVKGTHAIRRTRGSSSRMRCARSLGSSGSWTAVSAGLPSDCFRGKRMP